jgi:hypothetical protein
MGKDTNQERDREFFAMLQAQAPEVLGAKADFEALFGNILYASGGCVSLGPQHKRIFTKLKKRPRRKT